MVGIWKWLHVMKEGSDGDVTTGPTQAPGPPIAGWIQALICQDPVGRRPWSGSAQLSVIGGTAPCCATVW